MVLTSDIQNALGATPTGAGKRDNMGLVDSCDWSLSNGSDLYVSLYATPVGSPVVSSKTSHDTTYESVAGLGTQAVYKNDSSPVIRLSETVEVVAGQQHFDVHYVNALTAGGGPAKAALIALAHTILTRLPG